MKKGVNRLSILAITIMLLSFSSASVSAPLMVEKNLFSRNRKPPSQESVSATRNGRPLPLPHWIQLDGIIVHNTTKKALIRLRRRPAPKVGIKPEFPFLVVREGEAIEDFKVARINNRSIWLEKAGIQYELSLFSKKSRILTSASPAPGSVSADKRE